MRTRHVGFPHKIAEGQFICYLVLGRKIDNSSMFSADIKEQKYNGNNINIVLCNIVAAKGAIIQ